MSPDYQAGDVVKVSRTVTITAVDPVAEWGGAIYGRDVRSGHGVTVKTRDDGTLKVEMVRRSPRRGSKPAAGAVIRGRDVKRIWWKRGTIFQFNCEQEVSALVLGGDGLLYLVDDPTATTLEFEELNDDAGFKLLHVA